MIVSGGVAPWKGNEGHRQRLIGARNACALAINLNQTDADVVIAGVLTRGHELADLHREDRLEPWAQLAPDGGLNH
jgi:hypothetical protein